MRFAIFRIFVFSSLTLLGISLFHTQVVGGRRYRKLSEQNRIRLIPLESPRGRVFDRAGRLLATNRPSYNLVATPEDITPQVFSRLAGLLSVPEKEIRKRMSEPREYPFAPAVIAEDISRELVFKIEERKSDLPGVRIQISGIRYYPYEETGSHLIGYIGKVNPEEYKVLPRERFGMNSLIGRAGIEKLFDEKLRGWRGGRQIEVNALGEMIQLISEKPPEAGKDLRLSIDLEFQKEIMELIRGKHAAVAVMDLKTEGLIALASNPSYNPNFFVSPGKGKERMDYIKSSQAPLLDRGVSSAYPPGSVFKLVTALAALELGKITPNTRFHCNSTFRLKPGARPFHCWYEKGHGSLNLYEAIERSCNVFFYNVGSRLSPDDIAKISRVLGLGESLSLEATHVSAGLVPDSEWKRTRLKEPWYQGETLSFAIGQGYLLTSPVQILRLVGILAKEGKWVEPRLILDGHGRIPKVSKIAIKSENLKVIKRAMLNVVESDYGTGQLARVDFAKLAAKTGTAQVPPKTAHSWMTGFFPYENPEIAFVVFVEHGGSGGLTSAKIVKSMLQIWNKTYAPSVV
ncbi:MAG: penicillin-binding protein 2 [Candidatus Omnitrophica bacterium]|nr:penicillin-binding protein 2 [Candidatus Omnitrophota bacterium]